MHGYNQKVEVVAKLIEKYKEDEYEKYFIVERPEWDTQYLYYNVYFNIESEYMDYGYTPVYEMVEENEIQILVDYLKERFSLPVYKWERIKVEF